MSSIVYVQKPQKREREGYMDGLGESCVLVFVHYACPPVFMYVFICLILFGCGSLLFCLRS